MLLTLCKNEQIEVEKYGNGNFKKAESWYKEKGKKISIVKRYYINGNLMSISKKINGMKSGSFSWYHENGTIEAKGKYLNDSIQFFESYYDSNGNSQIKNGNGIIKHYYENGNLFYVARYINGLANGLQIYYLENGNKERVIPFKNGYRHGLYVEFNSKGDTLLTVLYRDNYPVKMNSYDEMYNPSIELYR